MYICIYSYRDGELILFHHEGGVDIGDADEKSLRYNIPIDEQFDLQTMETQLLVNVPEAKKR